MADLVHLTPLRNARRIVRSGVAARSHGWATARGVYCMPVLPSFTLTYQWVRELRRWHPGVLVAVHIRLPDDETVIVGRYADKPQTLGAAQACAVIRGAANPRGYQIFVPRRIAASEVRHVRRIPQGVGWRHFPDAHGQPPRPCCLERGTPGAARLRRRLGEP